MAREGNSINAKIGLGMGVEDDKFRKRGPNQVLDFKTISEWIRIQGFDEYTTQGLIDIASTYPTSALGSFRRNFNLMISRVREKRKKEQEGTDG